MLNLDPCLPGASDGRIHCWNAETGVRVCTLTSESMAGQTIVAMNPKFMLLVSASNQLVRFLNFSIFDSISLSLA